MITGTTNFESFGHKEDPLAKYFKDLGFTLDWDYDYQYKWHELLLDKKMILQVEMGLTKTKFLKGIDMLLINDKANVGFFIATNLSPNDFKEFLIKYFKS